MLKRIVIVAATLIITACSSLPPAPRTVDSESYRYEIAPGDKLEITVWRNPELSAKVPVGPDGKITSPLIEDVTAAGKTPEALAREIEAGLKKYIRDPNVTVLVTEFVGNPRSQVRVVGQARKPAALPFRQGMTLLDVMIAVGGLTDFAAGNRAVLIRQSDGDKQYSVRIQDLLRSGDVSANVQIMPGDVIMIPESAL
ncbi:MAG: polysaccharide export protein [Burkholderiaceae bacterium]